jgi:8-oxo-dGTP pyrophosphatase MutT (NUDIX family)
VSDVRGEELEVGRDEFDYDATHRELMEEFGVRLLVIRLYFKERRPCAEVAAATGMSVSALRSIIHRHLEKDRKRKQRCESAPFLDFSQDDFVGSE